MQRTHFTPHYTLYNVYVTNKAHPSLICNLLLYVEAGVDLLLWRSDMLN